MDKKIKYASINEVKSVDSDNRIIEFTASKEIPDYDNDVVKLEGMDISKIKKNKSFLWSHQQGMPPVGKIVKIWKDGKLLKGKAQMTSEEEYPFGYTIYKLIKGGYINNISISFLPQWDSIEYKEDKQGNRTQIINKSTLLECSAVNIGCNTGTSIAVKSLKDAANKAWNDQILDGKDLNEFEEVMDEIEETPAKEEKDITPPVMDYEKEITALKAEIDELKESNHIFKLFDSQVDVYGELLEELNEEDVYSKILKSIS